MDVKFWFGLKFFVTLEQRGRGGLWIKWSREKKNREIYHNFLRKKIVGWPLFDYILDKLQ